MPTSDERRLKLIKGLSVGGASRAGRTVTRRTVARRSAQDTVEEMLRRLDEEPATDVESGGDTEATGDVDPGANGVAADDPATKDDAGARDDPAAVDEAATRDDAAARDDATARDDPAAGKVGAAAEGGEPVRRRPRFRPRLRRPATVTLLLTAVLCLALVAAGFAGHRWYQDRALEQARQHALAAAKQTTVNFVSISASSVDRDLGRIVAGSTGEFKEQFTRGQDQVRAAVMENKVESQGTVLRAGLLSAGRSSAVALVAVDATVKNSRAPQGRDSHYRIQVDLTRDRDSGAWLVSRLQFVG